MARKRGGGETVKKLRMCPRFSYCDGTQEDKRKAPCFDFWPNCLPVFISLSWFQVLSSSYTTFSHRLTSPLEIRLLPDKNLFLGGTHIDSFSFFLVERDILFK